LDLICDVYWMRLLDEATAKLDLEAVNGHRVDEDLKLAENFSKDSLIGKARAHTHLT